MDYIAKIIKISNQDEAAALLAKIGCDPVGIGIMTPKALFFNVFIEAIPTKSANLLKQTFLAKGAEVAVTRGTADLSVEKTDVLICGTLKQYRLALGQLKQQPWGLPGIAAAVAKVLENAAHPACRNYDQHKPSWSVQAGKTLIMGILNLTPDSFSDGGQYNNVDAAVAHARKIIADGADILDVGAESTRPYGGAVKISAAEEIARLKPVLEKIIPMTTVPISIDTYKSEVAEMALSCGAHIINDIWGLQNDPGMAEVAARYQTPVVVMHNRLTTESSRDIISELLGFFGRSLDIGLKSGISPDRFIIDPGIGFGKTQAQNLEILARLAELKSLGCPILIGTSRKRFIGDILGLPVEERDEGTGATLVHAILNGAAIVRVHNVRMAVRMAKMTDALKDWRQNAHG